MNKKILTLLLIIGSLAEAFAVKPPVKYWISFIDKNGTPFSISRPGEFLGERAVHRRAMYNITVDVTDLPVTPAYVSDIEALAHVNVVYASKWLNGVVIAIDSSDWTSTVLAQISNYSFVKGSTKVKRYKVDLPVPSGSVQSVSVHSKESGETSASAASVFNYGRSFWQNRQIGVDCLHEKGFRGQGMVIAVMDNGFAYVDSNPIYDSLRINGGILGGRDFVSGGNNIYQGGTHGSMVFSCLAANKPGLIIGSAPMAKYWLLRTEAPEENIVEEYNWIRAAEFADSVGADVFTTSLGYTEFDVSDMNHTYQTLNGRTAPMSIAATMAARKGIFVLNAAGNERASPWHFINVAADADSICAVGSVDSLGNASGFSSVGPTADGRIKPDLVARGSNTWISMLNAEAFPGNGTSFATPVLAGAVACYWQAHKEYNNMQILRSLKNSASLRNDPNNDIGWGIPNMCPTLPLDFFASFDSKTNDLKIELIESDYRDITILVSDLAGKTLLKKEAVRSDRLFIIDGSIFAEEIYVIRVISSNGTKARKIVKR